MTSQTTVTDDAPEVFDLSATAIHNGTTVIEASAGTGKTYCLTGLVLRLLLEGRVNAIGRVLVVTFTVAASEELVHRIRTALNTAYQVLADEILPPDPFFEQLKVEHGGGNNAPGLRILRQARLELDDLMVVTIHGFAKRMLDQHAFESGLPFRQDFLEEAGQTLLEAAQDFWRQVFYRGDPLLAAIAAHRRWTPESFLQDFETYSRHPNTVLLPSVELSEVRHKLRRAQEQLSGALATPGALTDLGRTLSSVKFKSNSKNRFNTASITPLLRQLEVFAQQGDAAGLAAAENLALENLKRYVFKKDHRRLDHLPVPKACQLLRDAVEALEHALRQAFFQRVGRLFEAQKQKAGRLTFDDLLLLLHRALQDGTRRRSLEKAVREQFHAALIDEFQDTDLIQYAIFRQLFRGAPLFLIGDPKQAIYRFRGADIFAYMKARRDADAVYTLQENWRSLPPLIDAVNTLFAVSPRAFVFAEIPFQPVKAAPREPLDGLHCGDDTAAPLHWLWLPQTPNREDASKLLRIFIRDEIRRLLVDGRLKPDSASSRRAVEPGDIAILVRTNRQAQDVRDALQEVDIPAVLSRAGNIFDSPEMDDLERLLEAIAEPTHGPRLRAAAATVLWGDDAAALQALDEDDLAWQQRVDTLMDLRRRWTRVGFMPMMQQLIRSQGLKSRLLALRDGERRLTNLLHAAELLHQASHQNHLSPTGLLRWLETERHRKNRESDSAELRLDSDAKAVQISTIHKSKGLEYNIVFCPYLWQSRRLKKKPVLAHTDDDRRVFDFGSDKLEYHHGLAEAELLAEELRLAYVAITRARQRCYIAWGNIGRANEAATSALAYLLHRPICGPTLSFNPSPAEWAAQVSHEMASHFNRWTDLMQSWVAEHPETMAWRPVAASALAEPTAQPVETLEPLDSLQFPADAHNRLSPWTMVSFTSLSRPDTQRPAESPEHDDPPDAPHTAAQPEGIFAFAQGRQAGHCLHHLLEHCDLAAIDDDATTALIKQSLRRFGLDTPLAHRGPIDPAAVLRRLLHRVAEARLPTTNFSLGDVERSRWRVEEKFYAPIQRLSGHRLASLFTEHGTGRIATSYGPRLDALQGSNIAGFLTGIIDLVFEYQGRWWMADWKSNHLGLSIQDYGDEAIWRAMQHHHYVLQYHLYTLALHRHLRSRLPDYDYSQHMGGVFYVFLRGLSPSSPGTPPSEYGWYWDRPCEALIDALDRAATEESRP